MLKYTRLPATRGGLPQSATSGTIDRVICAVYEDKSSIDVKVGLAFIDLGVGQITLSTILDTQTFVRTIHKIQIYSPNEILVPVSYLKPTPNKIASMLQSNIDDGVKIARAEQKNFDDVQGMVNVENLAFEEDVKYLKEELSDKHHALSALAAALTHVKWSNRYHRIEYIKFKIKYEVPESTMFIDSRAAKSLQLVENLEDKKGSSLFKFLNMTLTKMGERALRNSILQPLTDKESINMRLNAVKELMNNEKLLLETRKHLDRLQDLDKLFAILLMVNKSTVESSHTANQMLVLKQIVNRTLIAGRALEKVESPLLQQIRDILVDDGVKAVKGLVDACICEDCHWTPKPLDLRNQRTYAVKAGKNGLLDASRLAYKSIVDETLSLIERLNEENDFKVEQGYNAKRGFFVKLKRVNDRDSIPELFVQRKYKSTSVECTTLDIIKLNSRLDNTVAEIAMISDSVLEELSNEMTDYLPILLMLSEAIAVLDLLQSFAIISLKGEYIVPEFSDMMTLKASRHPVLEKMVKEFIPNDICAIKDTSKVQVITGTNMSGKSVYLRQVALLSIMAQMGCLVPADYAMFPLFKSIKARICSDNFGSTTSSFAQEMNEILCVLEDADEDSLVIVDELGRGTSLNDGFAISLAISEYLQSTGAIVFISTHFHELSKILGTKQGVIQNHMGSVSENNQLKMSYKISSGISDIKRYGVQMAAKFFGPRVIERAYEISEKLERKSFKVNPIREEQMAKNSKVLNLVRVLQYVRDSDEEVTREMLLQIQNEFLAE